MESSSSANVVRACCAIGVESIPSVMVTLDAI